MVYRRRDNTTGKLRRGWTCMARTETGWKQMGTRTDNPAHPCTCGPEHF
jgi:hypothetical protein